MTKIFKMQIGMTSGSLDVFGDEEILQTAMREWEGWSADVVREEHAVLTIHGICDTADRAAVEVKVQLAEIRWMTVALYY